MKRTFILLSIVFFTLLLCLNCHAHGGRLDSNGGHWDHSSGTYHYHDGGGGSVSNSNNSNTEKNYYYHSNNSTTDSTQPKNESSEQSSSLNTTNNIQQKNSILDTIIKCYLLSCGVWLILTIILTLTVKILFRDISINFSETMWLIWGNVFFMGWIRLIYYIIYLLFCVLYHIFHGIIQTIIILFFRNKKE